uniref:Secreted protein n=1 Tax=Opuntia streptacantha TaxID=393608 RepID=A0A7C8YEF6_OPUST
MHFSFLCASLIVLQTTNGKSASLLLMGDTPSMLAQRNGADMKFLDVINSTNCKFSFFRDCKAVRECSCIKRAHVADFLQIHITIKQLFVAAVYNSWPIRGSKYMSCIF